MSIANPPSKSIEISNVGPISSLKIPVPEEGGVIVLCGSCGTGKTHGIQSVAALYDANARKGLRPQDGVPTGGKIEGLGVTVRLGRSNTSRGELECESLDSGVDPSLLVDPGLKDFLLADAARLRTLVKLAGIKIGVERWTAMADVFADEIALPDLVSDDPIKTADTIRRRLHDIARSKEMISSSKVTEGAALMNSIADVDLSVQVDATPQLERASQKVSELEAKRKLWLDSRAARAIALDELAEAEEKELPDGIDAEVASHRSRMEDAIESETLVRKRILAIEDQVAGLKAEIQVLWKESESFTNQMAVEKSKYDAALRRRQDAEMHRKQVEKLKEAVESSLPEEITPDQIDLAKKDKETALELVKQMRVVERARETEIKAKALIQEGNDLAAVAEVVRHIARSTDAVLEESLYEAGFDSIKVHDGRLCVESDRGLEPVSDLSTGERWRLALDLAAKGLPKGAILTVHQEGWQSLDFALREEVATMAKERGLLIVTAMVCDGELRAEVV